MSYTTFNGENRPYKVLIKNLNNKHHVAVINCTNDTLISTFVARTVMIGKSPKCSLTMTGTYGSTFDGNAILLYLGLYQYVYIGAEIYKFTAFGEIKEFISPVNSNNISYPYAIDGKNNTYLFKEHVVLMNLTSKEYSNPYDYYEDYRIITETKNSKKPKYTVDLSLDEGQPQQVQEIYVVDDQQCIKYEPTFTKLYNDLTKNGANKMYIVFANDPEKLVSIDIDDFKKLMYSFGVLAHFRSFKKVVNIV